MPTIFISTERWLSGRKQRFAKPSYWPKPVPGVRIPPSPPVHFYPINIYLFYPCIYSATIQEQFGVFFACSQPVRQREVPGRILAISKD